MSAPDYTADLTYQALLKGILAEPAEDTHRLVLADWLQENGQEARAEFIRVQVELAGLDRKACAWVAEGGPDCESWNNTRGEFRAVLWCQACSRARDLRTRERELWDKADHNKVMWRWGIGGNFRHTIHTGPRGSLPAFADRPDCCALFTRGFVSAVNCPANIWLSEADTITARHPIERVTLTTHSRLFFRANGDGTWKNGRWHGIKFLLPETIGTDPETPV